MRVKNIRNLASAAAVCGMVMALGSTVLAKADFSQATAWAGSTNVTAEVGYNGTRGYAFVSADNYVDASMDGSLYYMTSAVRVKMTGAFNEKAYGEVARECPGEVFKAECMFVVDSSDGEWSWFGSTGN